MKTKNDTLHTLTRSLLALVSVIVLLPACDGDLTATETDANEDEFRAMEGTFEEVPEPCKEDSDCDFGYVCEVLGTDCSGELGCVPGCRDNLDCEGTEVCTHVECFTCPCADSCEPAVRIIR
jgi:hypothetical protein